MRVPSEVKPEDLSNSSVGQWILPGYRIAAPVDHPLLVVKRLGDSIGNIAIGNVPSELWLVPLDEGEPKKIGNSPVGVTSVAKSHDGVRLAYVVNNSGSQTASEIWALENFLPTKK